MFKIAIACGIVTVLFLILIVVLLCKGSSSVRTQQEPVTLKPAVIDSDNKVYIPPTTSSVSGYVSDHVLISHPDGETPLEDFGMYTGALESTLEAEGKFAHQPGSGRYTKRGLARIRNVHSVNNSLSENFEMVRFQTPTVVVQTDNPQWSTHVRPNVDDN